MDLFQNPYQVIRFIVDNNPAAVQANLSGLGLLSGVPQDLSNDDIYDQVVELYDSDQDDFVRQVLEVPYIDAPGTGIGEYTGGYREELEAGQTIDIIDSNDREPITAAALVALIGGITSLGAGFFGWKASQEQSEAAQSQVDAALIYQQASESRKILGLDPIAFSAIVVVLAAIVITLIIVISRRK